MTSDLHDLSGAFAVDALDDEERRRYEQHLDACADCRREVADLHAAVASLAEEEAPPPGLRGRVLTEARRTPQLAPPALPPPVRSPVTSLASRRRGTVWALSAVAAAFVLAVVGLSAALLRTTAQVDELEAALADAQQAQQLAALLESPDARIAELDTPAGVRARFMWSEEQGEGVFMAGDLPAPAPGTTYALWLIDDGDPRFAGAFEPGPDGRAVTAASGDVAAAEVVAVTVEPRGPIDDPTTEPFISGALT